jgi:hypothetical protein
MLFVLPVLFVLLFRGREKSTGAVSGAEGKLFV